MIMKDSLARFIDVRSQQFHALHLSAFCQKYYACISEDTDIKTVYDLINGEHLMIQDLFGWTRIHRLIKWKTPATETRKLWQIQFENETIMIDDDALLPIWDPRDMEIGFHGLIKYPYQLINPCMLEEMEGKGWRMRFPDVNHEFQQSLDIKSGTSLLGEPVYSIWTESGFFNINGVNLFGSGYIPAEKIIVRRDFKIE